ncbi:hypothetical protein [Novipirellula artificiosorum]|uniref:Secreted protein n=1 Tax=Novipirellula artificiosorum TaxID=2528016 RepID=A0A5C6DCL7_9BACT|nr:hypothetical protein [Novipirellula artificiosorum]TWU34510.1 hypothetical protein Poly41_46580 [Novipirellula artificiosorum]
MINPSVGKKDVRGITGCLRRAFSLVCVVVLTSSIARAVDTAATPSQADAAAQAADLEALEDEQPWDFSPYRVLVWVVSDNPDLDTTAIEADLRRFLDRDFMSIWEMDIVDAPPSVKTAAVRNLSTMRFEEISASDPVVAVKRDHPDAVRLRIAANVGDYCQNVLATRGRIDEVERRAEEIGNPTIDGVKSRLKAVEGDTITVRDRWSDPATEAILVSRGMAMTLENPDAKIIPIPQSGLVMDAVAAYDKIFVVRIQTRDVPTQISAIEFDTLMRHFGTVATHTCLQRSDIPAAVGDALTDAFGPMVRIEDAGRRSARGLIRAGGLILDPNSPAMIHPGDALEPMIRKDDRNGNPILIGPIDWAYLLVKEPKQDLEPEQEASGVEQEDSEVDAKKEQQETEVVHNHSKVEMDYFAGRPITLQGRRNRRTFKTAIRVRPVDDATVVRLHAQGDEGFPLIGYEIYDKDLETGVYSLIGRTDWNGRLEVGRSDKPMRLMYVKNGGAILARLPIVPGLTPLEVADLRGDDMRLEAEAYIHGVRNAIIDLIAIRELFAARIRLRLRNGEIAEAENLLNDLREQPTSERLADDMGKKQTAFLKALGSRNVSQRRKIDEMFSETRELLSKHINPAKLRDLDADLIAARKNGGRLPEKAEDDQDDDKVVDTTKPTGTRSAEMSPSADFGNFTFSVPNGWNAVSTDRSKTAAMLLLGGKVWQKSDAMIKVDVGNPSAPSPKELAEAFAKQNGGTVDGKTKSFDGVDGVCVTTSSTTLDKPKSLTILFRGGKAYLVMAAAKGDTDVDATMEQIRKTWKWKN